MDDISRGPIGVLSPCEGIILINDINRSSSKISDNTSAELKCTTAVVTSTEGSLNRMNLLVGAL